MLEYDAEKVDEFALALLFLTLHDDYRVWKGLAWEVANRLYEKGWIEDPRNKAKSFVLTSEGLATCKALFEKHFSLNTSGDQGELDTLVEYCKAHLDLEHAKPPSEYEYNSVPLCIIDAIFSVNAVYTATRNVVQRFIEYFNIPSGFTVSEFVELYQLHSVEFMAESVYQNRQRTSTKNGILKAEAVLHVAKLFQKYGAEDFDRISFVLNNPKFESEYKRIRGQGSGVTLNYLYMLLGSEAEVKPDRMVLRFVSSALGRLVDVEEAVSLLKTVSALLVKTYPALSPRSLDYAIWQYQRSQK